MNLYISFKIPLLLLTMILGFIIFLYLFFKVPKPFRYTLNRILSLSCSLLIVIFVSFLISGMTFHQRKLNKNNEIIILVDKSFSNQEEENFKNEFIKKIIKANIKGSKLGIVTFGENPVYSVPLTSDFKNIYSDYLKSTSPIDSASDFKKALIFCKSKFSDKKSGKIVLLTDGFSTDGELEDAFKSVVSNRLQLDVVYFPNKVNNSDIQLLGIETPKSAVFINKEVSIGIKVKSGEESATVVKFFDNDNEIFSQVKALKAGENFFEFKHTFTKKGIHKIMFQLSADDHNKKNNQIISYIDIDIVDRVLILERENEGKILYNILKNNLKVDLKNIKAFPESLNALCEYDQVILVNIANSDLPAKADTLLDSYVRERGGSLFTIGGNKIVDGNKINNTYNLLDMKGTLYQEMLPVLAENYTPPIAVVLVIDVSGSMGTISSSGLTLMKEATNNALEGLKALDSRDYLGVVTFASEAKIVLQPTLVADNNQITEAITGINYEMSGTVYSHGIEKASLLLKSMTQVNKKHIIFISDGLPSGGDSQYLNKIKHAKTLGITTSTISFTEEVSVMKKMAELGGGKYYFAGNGEDLAKSISKDLTEPEIREYMIESFVPKINLFFTDIKEDTIPPLDGFYGTRLKKQAKNIISGKYNQPIYATINYGKGLVSSFMCDLNNEWSQTFLANDVGISLVTRMIENNFPLFKIKNNELELGIRKQNYEYYLSIYSKEKTSSPIHINVYEVFENSKRKVKEMFFADFDGHMLSKIKLTKPGLYQVEAVKLEGNDIKTVNNLYITFSYSEEYDTNKTTTDNLSYVLTATQNSNSRLINKGYEVYQNVEKYFYKTRDLRIMFAIIIMVLFLSEIALRKFKIKLNIFKRKSVKL